MNGSSGGQWALGVISYGQSDTGRGAAYGFFILGGLCVSYGAPYISRLEVELVPMSSLTSDGGGRATLGGLKLTWGGLNLPHRGLNVSQEG